MELDDLCALNKQNWAVGCRPALWQHLPLCGSWLKVAAVPQEEPHPRQTDKRQRGLCSTSRRKTAVRGERGDVWWVWDWFTGGQLAMLNDCLCLLRMHSNAHIHEWAWHQWSIYYKVTLFHLSFLSNFTVWVFSMQGIIFLYWLDLSDVVLSGWSWFTLTVSLCSDSRTSDGTLQHTLLCHHTL